MPQKIQMQGGGEREAEGEVVEVLKQGAEGVVEALGGGAALLEPEQDLGGAEGEVEVQVVPRQCPVGLESRPAERLPASLAQKQRSPPAQSLEESPQRQGQLQREKGEH